MNKSLQIEIKIVKNRMRYGIKYENQSSDFQSDSTIACYAMVIDSVRKRRFKSYSACNGQIAKWIKASINKTILKAQVLRLKNASLKIIKSVRITVLSIISGTRFRGMSLGKLSFSVTNQIF